MTSVNVENAKLEVKSHYENTDWYIWSNEHGAWWAPNHLGYTTDRTQAGLYKYRVACQIVADANRYQGIDEVPNETMVKAG